MLFNTPKVTFQVRLIIRELLNLPYVSGQYFVKWKLKQRKGTSPRETVKNHSVAWNLELDPTVDISVDKATRTLRPCDLLISIRQEAGRSEEPLGDVTINLSEFADKRSMTCRFLLQNSKVTIQMKLVKGNPDFITPPCSVPKENVVDGLRGIMNEGDDKTPIRINTHSPGRSMSISALAQLSPDHEVHKEVVDKIFKNATNSGNPNNLPSKNNLSSLM